MEHFSDSSESRTDIIIRDLELGREVLDGIRNTAVTKYLMDHKRKLEKEVKLKPECLMIAEHELSNTKWADECLKKWVKDMFFGADLSQLESFFSRYSHTKRNKTSFFLSFIKNEL